MLPKSGTVLSCFSLVQPSLLLINHDRQEGWMGVVECECKRISNDQNQNFLDLKAANYDICMFVRVGVPSTYL